MILPEGSIPALGFSEITCSTFKTRRSFQPKRPDPTPMRSEGAEVLSFTTHADSGKMPGVLPSMGVGELVLGAITLITAIEDAAGQKIYSSQIQYLAGKTADQVADYLSQYSADEGWISRNKAKSVKFAG